MSFTIHRSSGNQRVESKPKKSKKLKTLESILLSLHMSAA